MAWPVGKDWPSVGQNARAHPAAMTLVQSALALTPEQSARSLSKLRSSQVRKLRSSPAKNRVQRVASVQRADGRDTPGLPISDSCHPEIYVKRKHSLHWRVNGRSMPAQAGSTSMQTVLVILGIWLLINVLFVVIMIPPRKPGKPDQTRSSSALAPVPIGRNADAFDEDEKISLRHTIIAIAMATLFSPTPLLLEALDDIKRMIGKYRKPRQRAAAGEGNGRSREMASAGSPCGRLRRQQTELRPASRTRRSTRA